MMIAIYGKSDSGKSTSIRWIFSLLRNNPTYKLYEDYVYESNADDINNDVYKISKDNFDKIDPNGKTDFIAIFQNIENATFILLSSAGDFGVYIEKNFRNLVYIINEKLDLNWEDIKKDNSKYLFIQGIKYGKKTQAAYEREGLVKSITNDTSITWMQPPYVKEISKNDLIYQNIYKAFSCGVLANFDNFYKHTINTTPIDKN